MYFSFQTFNPVMYLVMISFQTFNLILIITIENTAAWLKSDPPRLFLSDWVFEEELFFPAMCLQPDIF